VLRPLGLLLAAAASGFGMWHALMQDGVTPAGAQLSRRNGGHVERTERSGRR
jgi:hypothetical protein